MQEFLKGAKKPRSVGAKTSCSEESSIPARQRGFHFEKKRAPTVPSFRAKQFRFRPIIPPADPLDWRIRAGDAPKPHEGARQPHTMVFTAHNITSRRGRALRARRLVLLDGV
jgi:hypothetical protein